MSFTELCGGLWLDCIEYFQREILQVPLILEFLETGPDHNFGGYAPLLNPTLSMGFVSSLTAPANQYREDVGDEAYELSYLSEKTRTPNHLRPSLSVDDTFYVKQ